jgi:hypothetical protein
MDLGCGSSGRAPAPWVQALVRSKKKRGEEGRKGGREGGRKEGNTERKKQKIGFLEKPIKKVIAEKIE